MSDRFKRELSININTNVDTKPIRDAENILSGFFKTYEDKSLELGIDTKSLKIDTKDFNKAISATRELGKEIDKVRRTAPTMLNALGKDVTFYDDVKKELADVVAIFDDKSVANGFDEMMSKLDDGFSVIAIDLGNRVQYLRSQIKDYISQLRDSGNIEDDYWGNLDYSSGNMDYLQLQNRIDLVKKLISYQKELEIFNRESFNDKNAPLEQTNGTVEYYLKQLEKDVTYLEEYNLRTTEQLRKREELIEKATSPLWSEFDHSSAKENVKDDDVFDYNIQQLKEYVQARQDAIVQLKANEDELFSVDGISEYVSEANIEIERLQSCMKELQDLRNGTPKTEIDADSIVGGNLKEVIEALGKIEQAIKNVTDAFKPLTDALLNEDSAISAMVKANIEDLQKLQNEVAKTFINIQTLSEKDFSSKTTNVVQQTINSPGGVLKAQRAELKELAKLLSQYQATIGNLNSQFNIFKRIGLSSAGHLDFFSFDLNEILAGIKKSTTADKLDGWADVLEDYKNGIIKISNEINKIQSGLVNLDHLNNLKKHDPEIINIGKTSSNVDGILDEVKSIRDQINVEIQGIRDSFDDIFKFDFLNPNIDNITNITEQIYQKFVELQNNINSLDFDIKIPSVEGLERVKELIEAEGNAAQEATPKKEAFTAANNRVAESARKTAEDTAKAADGIKKEDYQAKQASSDKNNLSEVKEKVVANANGIVEKVQKTADEIKEESEEIERIFANSINPERISTQYGNSRRKWNEYARNTLDESAKQIANNFNAAIGTSGINISSIDTSIYDKKSKTEDGDDVLYEVVKLVAKGTDAVGEIVTITHEYNLASAALETEATKFHNALNKFDVETAKATAASQVKELKSQMGSFKFDITGLEESQGLIADKESLDVFNNKLKEAKQTLAEIKAKLKSAHSLDPVVNTENSMDNLDTFVKTYRENIKKFSDVEGYNKLEDTLNRITAKLGEFNKAKEEGNGNAMADAVAEINKEIASYNANLKLVTSKYQENKRNTREQEKEYKNLIKLQKQLYDDKVKLAKAEYGSADEQIYKARVEESQKNYDEALALLQNQENRNKLKQEEIRLEKELTAIVDERRKKEEDLAWAQKEKENENKKNKEIESAYRERAEAIKAEVDAEKELAAARKESEAFYKQEEKTRKAEEDAAWAEYEAEKKAAAEKEMQMKQMFEIQKKKEEEAEKEEIRIKKQTKKEIDEYFTPIEKAEQAEIDAKEKQHRLIQEQELNSLYRERAQIISEIIKYNKKEKELKTDKGKERAKSNREDAEKRLAAIDEEINKYGAFVKQSKLDQQNDRLIGRLYDSNKSSNLSNEEKQSLESLNKLLKEREGSQSKILNLQQQLNKATGDEERKKIEEELNLENAVYNALTKKLQAYKDIYSQQKIAEQDEKFLDQQVWAETQRGIKEASDRDKNSLEEQKQDYRDITSLVDGLYNAQKELHKINVDTSGTVHSSQREEEIKKVKELSMLLKEVYGIDIKNMAESLSKSGLLSQEQKNSLLEKERKYRQDILDLTAKAADKDADSARKKQEKQNKENQNYGKSEFNKYKNFLDDMNANIRSLKNDGDISQYLQEMVNEYTSAYEKIRDLRKKFSEDPSASNNIKLTDDFDDAVLQAEKLRKKIEDIFKQANKFDDFEEIGKSMSFKDLFPDDIKTSLVAYANALTDGKIKLEGFNEAGTELYGVLEKGNGSVEQITFALRNGTDQLHAYKTATSSATNEWESFKSQIVDGAKNMVGMYVGTQEAIQALRAGVNYVKEIDLAMTELKKVTNETDEAYRQFLEDAASTSSIIGSTISDFTEAAATFARLGYSLDESSKMAETAIIYKNVADGLDTVEEASDSIISTMMAFGIEANDTMGIIDRFNEVGNNFAITSAGIGDALQRSASALYSAGNTIDESIALVTAANSVIQNPEQVGTALKTLALRLRGAKVELEDAGLETDAMAESTSQLQAKLKALTHGKVDIMLDADTFKSTTQILREMSEAWEDMTDIERASALELMGGKRQANILSSVIQNFETVEKVIETSMDSSGSAIAENEKYLDSIQGRLDLFSNSLQKFWSNLISSDFIKGAVDHGTWFINFLDTAYGKFIALIAAVQAISKFKGFSILGIGKSLVDSIKNITAAQETLNNLKTTASIGVGFDPTNVNMYAAAVSNLTAKQQANMLASVGLSKAQIQLALQYNGLSDDVIREATAHVFSKQTKDQENLSDQQLLTNKIALSIAILKQKNDEDSLAAAKWLNINASKVATIEEMKQLIATSNLSDTQKAAAIAALTQSSANMTLSGSLKAVGASIKALFDANPVGFVLTIATTVASILIPAISKAHKSIEELSESADKAINKYKESKKELQDQKSSIDELAHSYSTLSDGVNFLDNTNINLSTASYQEYLDTCNKIADMYPHLVAGYDAQGNAILSLKGNVDQLIQSYNDAAQAARQEMIADGDDVFKAFQKTYDNVGYGIFNGESGNKQKLEAAQEMLNAINTGNQREIQKFIDKNYARGKWHDDIEDMLKEAGIKTEDLLNGEIADVGKMQQQAGKLTSFIKSMTTKINAETSKVKTLMDAYLGEDLGYASFDNETRAMVDRLVSGLSADFINEFESADDLWYWIKSNIVDVFADPSIKNRISDNLKNAFDLQSQFENNEINIQQYQKGILSFVEKIKNSGLGEEVQKQILQMFDIDISKEGSIGTGIDAMLAHAKTVVDNSEEAVTKQLEQLGKDGTVNLLLRPKVEASVANQSDWNLQKGEIATVLSETFSNEDGTIAMNFTPIVADENGNFIKMLTPDELQAYAEDVIAGVKEDDLNLKIGTTYEGENAIEQAVQDAKIIHDLHDMYYLGNYEIPFDELSYSDLQIINSDQFNVDGSVISSWEQLQYEIQQARIAMTKDFTTDNFVEYAESINSISSSISTYQGALEKLESGSFTMSDFMALIAEFPELADGVDISSKSFDGLSKNLMKAIRNSPDDLVDELKELREQLILAGKSTTAIDQLISSVENMPVDAVASLTNEYITLTDQINEAKIAQNELKEAMQENPNEGYETRGSAIEQMKTLMEEGKIGSESELWSIAEAFGFTYDSAKSINENADALYNFINARNEWYATDKDGNYTFEGTESFLNDVETVVANNKKLQEMGVKWSYENGVLDFDFNNADWNEIVKILGESKELAGLTSEEFYDLLMQVGQFFDINWQDADDLTWFLGEINKNSESVSENFDDAKNAVQSFLESNDISLDWLDEDIDIINTDEFKKLPEEIQKVLEEYYKIKKKFEEDPLGINFQLNKDSKKNLEKGLTDESLSAINQLVSTATNTELGVTWFSFDELRAKAKEAGMDVETLMQQIEELEKAGKVIDLKTTSEDPLGLISMQNNAEATISYIEALGLAGSQLNGAFTIDVPSFIGIMAAAGWSADQISTYIASLNAQGYTFTYTTEENQVQVLDVNTEEGQAKVNELVEKSNEMTDTETLTVNIAGTANGALKAMQSRLEHITSKTWEVTINETTNKKTVNGDGDANGTVHVSGTAHAHGTALKSGSWGAPKTTTALTGELGPELLVRGNRWTLIGENGAEFTQVKKGDIIFNHKQTEDLLSKGYVTGRGRAYASGTAYASGSGSHTNYKFDNTSGSEASKTAGSLSDAANEFSQSAEDFKEIFDWIAVRIEEITEDLDLKDAKLANAVGHSNQNKIIDDMIKINEQLYNNLTAGAKKYYSFAAELLKNIPAEYRAAAQDGSIAIESFVGKVDEKTLEAIQEYREWVQKGADATQQAEEILTEISALAKQAIDNIASDYDNKSSIRNNEIDQLGAYNELSEAKYGSESSNIYEEMIKETNKNIKTLQEKRNKMQAELNEQVETGNIKKYSQDWYDAVNDIAAVDTEIIELTTDTYEYQDAINELHWDHFDNLMSQYEAISDEAENLIDIIGNKDLFDKDTGEWTDEGITTLGLYAQQMENAEMQAKQYEEEISYLNKNWKKLGYTEQEYLEKLEELKSGQYDAIKSYNDTKDAIVDLNSTRVDAIKEGIQKEIEAYEELINKKKEELDAEKDLHDFQKGVMDQQKNIADIERQLAAISSDNSASARAKRAQLEAELAEAKAELEETYYDRSITDQQDALDKELEGFREEKDKEIEEWDKYLENTELVVSESLSTIQANTDAVYQTLQDMGKEYGLSIAEVLTSPWKDGETAIQSYSEKFGLSISSTVEELKELEKEYEKIVNEIENSGKGSVDQVNTNTNTYQNEKQKEVKQENKKVETKTIQVGGKINAGSAKIYDYAGDKSGNNQYYSQDPIYTVLAIDGDWVKVRHHKLSSGTTGWFKKSEIKAYAKGTHGVYKDQLALIDELGEELVMHADKNGKLAFLSKGSSVIPHDISENLMKLGKLDPSTVLDQNRPVISAPHVTNNNIELNMEIAEVVHIDTVTNDTIPNLTKAIEKQMDKYMKNVNNSIRKYAR